MSLNFFNLTRTSDDIAWLTIQFKEQGLLEKRHQINAAFLYELLEVIGSIHEKKLKGLVINSGNPNTFLTSIEPETLQVIASQDAETVKKTMGFFSLGNQVCRQLERLNCPTVAVINGDCGAVGVEIAMACQYRIMVDNVASQLAYPEINLGFHIGFGGVTRLIERVGLHTALRFLTSKHPYGQQESLSSGMVDSITQAHKADKVAVRFLLQKQERKASALKQVIADKLVNPVNMLVEKSTTACVLPRQVLDKVVNTYRNYGTETTALQEEVTTATTLLLSRATENALYIHQLTTEPFFCEFKKLASPHALSNPLRIHIIGAGTMGKYLARLCALQNMIVSIHDIRHAALASVLPESNAYFYSLFPDHPVRIQQALQNIILDIHNTGLAQADIVIEAIQENKDAKASLLLEIDKQSKPAAFLLTTTSCFPLDELSKNMHVPERLLGLNIFHPVFQHPPHSAVSVNVAELMLPTVYDESIKKKAEQFVAQLEIRLVEVQSSPGFVSTRILMAYLMEALIIHQSGITIAEIDAAANELGMAYPPFILIDEIGLEECLRVQEALDDRLGCDVPQILMQKVEQGFKGKQSGEGFYKYKQGQRLSPLVGFIRQKLPMKQQKQSIKKRLLEKIINESRVCLNLELVKTPSDIDVLSVAIVGISAAKGGALRYLADTKGDVTSQVRQLDG